MRVLQDESGQTVILAALCITMLLGFLALSIDVGVMFYDRRTVQSAADSAALAGAQEILYGDVTNAARADAARNGYTNGNGGAAVAVDNPPLYGPHANNPAYVEVIVSTKQPTYFMSLFNTTSMTVSGRAVATTGTTQNCIYTLGSSGTDISLSNGVNIQTTGCALYADSSSSTDLTISGGATLNAAGVNLVGNYSATGGATLAPTPTTGEPPFSDPLGYLPTPTFNASSCIANPNLGGGGTFTIGPASGGTMCYNGLTVANGATASLRPGFYIINGALTIAGGSSISGSGVTFYLPPGGSLSLSNGINFNFTAPTSGTYNGILFYQNRTNSTPASIQGGSTSTLQGILYFPDANVSFGNGSATGTYASIVAKTLTFNGGTTLKNYALANASTPLSSPRLVE